MGRHPLLTVQKYTMESLKDDMRFAGNVKISVKALGRLRHQLAFAAKNTATFATLTHREREVLAEWASGKTNDIIAAEQIVSPHTIKTHRQNIRRKLRIHGVVEAVWWAQCFDLI